MTRRRQAKAPPSTPSTPGSAWSRSARRRWATSMAAKTRWPNLARRVQRKLLTVLFGQSGLGKTSILRAGIVPRLRPQGYCPVYVRIDYGRDAPSPAEQIKQAIFRETESSGTWSQTGVAVEGESLWEFLHHRDDTLRDANGRTLTPLLIFDQFEEIFTLAQSDDFGRQRAAEFIADLADLVENRPPKAVEARLDSDDSAIERFDFARSDYRILIALREDYLAHLEGLKGAMPSITQNRMRLARMTGAQALDAVIKPGGKLVSQEVAEAIVRFVAGGAELRNAEVEPSLLTPDLPRAERRAHRPGPERNLGRPAGRLARHDPGRVLRARAGRPAGRGAPLHRGRAAYRQRLSREHRPGEGRQGLCRGRCRARRAGQAGRPASAAHRGAAGHPPRRADARCALQRGARQPRPAPRARGPRRSRAPARGAARARGGEQARTGACAPDRGRLRRAGRGGRRRRRVRCLRHATRAEPRGRWPRPRAASRSG